MKKAIPFLSLLPRGFLHLIFFICAILPCAEQLTAQTSTPYKIAVYELSRAPKSWDDHYTYQIRNLFVRVGDSWMSPTNAMKTKYYLVYKGEKYDAIKGLCCGETPGWWYQVFDSAKKSGRFLKPEPTLTLTRNFIVEPFMNTDANLIKKAVLLTNNSAYTQNTHLASYLPNENEMKILLNSSKAYMTALLRANECVVSSFINIDTTLFYTVNAVDSILIDSSNCFIDQRGNKLINILFPAGLRLEGIYPFIGDCHREAQFRYFRILCYIAKAGKISFVGDNLQYLDHGDFDSDGKDEFLFWSTMHNHDGYVLLYDDFSKATELIWDYH